MGCAQKSLKCSVEPKRTGGVEQRQEAQQGPPSWAQQEAQQMHARQLRRSEAKQIQVQVKTAQRPLAAGFPAPQQLPLMDNYVFKPFLSDCAFVMRSHAISACPFAYLYSVLFHT